MTDYQPIQIADAEALPMASEPKMLEVVAPVDLNGGYELAVDYSGRTAIIQVPDGGVQQGQRFTGVILRMEDPGVIREGHQIPVGHWRDGICDCCILGCCHPSCCLSYFCAPCALGQVMTRMKLDKTGNPTTGREHGALSVFKFLFILTLAVFILDKVFALMLMPYQAKVEVDEYGNINVIEPDNIPGWYPVVHALSIMMGCGFALYLLIMTCRTRAYMRQKYAIPEQYCTGCEDCLCSYCCSLCTISQMLRHSADYRKYDAGCCTENGLTPLAPEVV